MSFLRRSTGHIRGSGLAGRRDFLIRAGSLVPASVWFALVPDRGLLALAAAPPFQDHWAHCVKCNLLFFNGNRNDKGSCAGQGEHKAEQVGGADRLYRVTFDDSTGPGQGEWRFCTKCFALFFGGYPEKRGVCAADGGNHNAAGYNFFLYHDRPAGRDEEANWRYCNKCQGLFRTANLKASVCPGNSGQAHVAAGYKFVVGQKGTCFDGC